MSHFDDQILDVDGVGFVSLQIGHNLIATLSLSYVINPLLVLLVPDNVSLNLVRSSNHSIGMVTETEEQEDSVDEIGLGLQVLRGIFQQNSEAQRQEANN